MRENRDKSMIESRVSTFMREPLQYADGETKGRAPFLQPWARTRTRGLNRATAIVASSNEETLQTLAEIVVQCGLAAFLAFTVDEGKRILRRQKVHLVVCEDCLIDGKYQDLLKETTRLLLKTPLIVVSRTGEWPEYLQAVGAGSFDYLPYPPIPEDLPRVIRYALLSQKASDNGSAAAERVRSSEGEKP